MVKRSARRLHIEHLDARYLMANGDESFDGVTAPALPVGWTQSTTSTNPWTTVSGGSDTAPNHAFVANLGNTADSALTSPSFLLTQTNGRLSFKHAYESETDWDGGVLEISVNAGAFTDIVTSGGTFISGGYDSPLFSGSGNPLANRAAWNGFSNGYISTVVDLPSSAYNQNVQLRWRFGSDSNTNFLGWQVDTITFANAPGPPTDDYGDAPTAAQSGFASSYPTLAANGGARHGVLAGFHLGAIKDLESDGLPNASATGDDSAPALSDDEDGVTFKNAFSIGSTATFNVALTNTAAVSNPFLDAWVDFNRDGDWNDAGEKIYSQIIANNTAINFLVPLGTASGISYARFRLHDGTTSIAPGGAIANGEVEDYRIQWVNRNWIEQGPSPTVNGQLRNVQPNNQINGAIQTVLAHPINPDILYVGAVNGGIWKTTNATATNPNWTAQTDQLDSLAIGAIAFDSTDATRNTLVAGTAQYSSFAGFGGTRGSVFRTTDGGTTWVNPGSIGLSSVGGENISGIAARGNTIVVSSSANSGGIFRSTNGGATFTGINSGGIVVNDNVFDLVEDPSDPTGNRLYAAVEDEAIYRSNDFGLTWTPVTSNAFNAEMNAMITNVANNNIEMAVHPTTGRLYVGILLSGQLRGVFYSDNASTASPTWTKMDVPILPIGAGVAVTGASNTNPITITSASAHGLSNGQFVAVNGVLGNTAANGIFTINVTSPTQFSLVGSVGNGAYTSGGIWTRVVTPNPSIKNIDETGAQGRIHFSIVVDPTNQNIVYIGGDRQEQPSSIGDTSFNAAIFRGNAAIASNPSVVPSPQWDHITHDSVAFDPPSGTASGSAPHADSREMIFDANGNLIETDDGGIFKRTNPRNNTGDWFSLVGDIGVTEVHDVAYDRLTDTLFIGTQDNGTHSQATAGSKVFNFFSGGDGGDVEIDNITLASTGQSIRYSSSQNLGGFLRSTWSASGGLVAASFPARTVVSGAAFSPAFRTPIELNAINPTRLIIQGSNSAYESLNQGETLTEVSAGNGAEFVDQNAIAYGGRKNGIDNEDLLWVSSFSTVSVRTAGTGPTALTSSQPSVFGTIRDLTIDPDDWASAFLVDEANQVFATNDTGSSWSNITGNLPTIGNVFWSVVYVASAINDAIVVGTNLGVFASKTSALGTWFQLGALLPHAAVYDLVYDDIDDVLVAGTLGRGAWNLMNASDAINLATPIVTITSGNQVYNNSTYVATASISGNNLPLPALSYVFYSDAGGTNVISAPVNVGTYFVRAVSAANTGNFAAQSSIASFQITQPAATIAQAYVFYNDSGFETFGGVSASIDNVGKQLLRSNGSTQTTTVSNISNYINGINGLVFDVNNLAAASLTASDFVFRMRQNTAFETANPVSWVIAPAPTVVNVTPGAPSRIRLEWANNAIQNTWLQVILKANSNTGLTNPVVFYIGHAAGEGAGSAPYRVGVAELSAIQAAVNSVLRPITDVRDVDKNRRVGVSDLSFVQSHVSSTILLDNITIPIAGSPAEGAPPPGPGFGSLVQANEGNGNGMASAAPPVELSSTFVKLSMASLKLTTINGTISQASLPTKTPVFVDAAISNLIASKLTSAESPTGSVESIDDFFKSFSKKKFGRL